MPEERFELVFVDEYDNTFSISDNDYIQENKHYHTLEEIIELLNQLNKDSKNLNELHEENQRLKSLFQSERRELVEQNNNYRQCLNKLKKENEELKQENSVFEGKDAKHYQRWVNQIKKYVEEDNPDFTYDEDFIIKIALSYTLQSLRNGESLKRFQWNYKELSE